MLIRKQFKDKLPFSPYLLALDLKKYSDNLFSTFKRGESPRCSLVADEDKRGKSKRLSWLGILHVCVRA